MRPSPVTANSLPSGKDRHTKKPAILVSVRPGLIVFFNTLFILPAFAANGDAAPFWTGDRVIFVAGTLIAAIILFCVTLRNRLLVHMNKRLRADMSERGRALDNVRIGEEKYRHLFTNMVEGAFYQQADGTLLDVNPAALEMFGLTKDQFMGRTSMDPRWRVVREDGTQLPGDQHPSMIALATGKPVYNRIVGVFNPRRDVIVWLAVSAIPLFENNSAAPDRVFVTMHDVTQLKSVEERRIEFERKFQQSQKLESLGVLAGGIAHDFNNLLAAIMGNLEMVIQEAALPDRSSVRLDRALTATRRAADLTRQMLAYSGRAHITPSRVDLNEMVEENSALFRSVIARTITMDIPLHMDSVIVKGDTAQIEQIIMNLLTNASEAIGDHPGTITLSTGVMNCSASYLASSRLEEKPAPGRYAYVEVSDTGCGMDFETQQRIFEPFFTTKFTGRGLGMAAALGIMRAHKGAIMIKSALNQGTTIRVLFPEHDAAPAAAGRESDIPDVQTPLPVKRRRVLIADDEPDVREFCADFLEQIGIETLSASDGEEAVLLFSRHAPSIGCVLLDLTMPKMDGIKAFHKLQIIDPGVRVLLCSGYDEKELAQRYTREAFAGYLQKPFQLDQLKNMIMNLLAQAEHRG